MLGCLFGSPRQAVALLPVRSSVAPSTGLVRINSTTRASATQVCSGALAQRTASAPYREVGVRAFSGEAAAFVSDASGCSVQFAEAYPESVSQFGSVLDERGQLCSTITQNLRTRLADGRVLSLVSGSQALETSSSGGAYLSLDGGPYQRLELTGDREFAYARPLERDGQLLVPFISRDASVDTSACLAVLALPDLTVESTVAAVGSDGWNFQSASMIELADGTLVMPYSKVPTAQVFTGPSVVGVAVSRDGGASWVTSANEVGAPLRGALEPMAYASQGRVVVLFRTDLGRVYRSYFDVTSLRLSAPQPTALLSPSAMIDVLSVPGFGPVVAFNAGPVLSDPRFPRKVIALATSDDDFTTLRSLLPVATSGSASASMLTPLPYVHHPRLSLVDDRLVISVDRVAKARSVRPFLVNQVEAMGYLFAPNIVRPGPLKVLYFTRTPGPYVAVVAATQHASFEVRSRR